MGGDGVFWDRVACVYDVFANVINRKANRALCAAVEPWIEPGDEVLECACGPGLLRGDGLLSEDAAPGGEEIRKARQYCL